MSKAEKFAFLHHPLVLGSFRNWVRLLQCCGGIDRPYWGRALLITAGSFFTIPLRWYERARFQKKLDALQLKEPPVFIIGHWRSGTTYLHNLMCQDAALDSVKTFQTVASEFSIVGEKWLKPLFASFAPEHRFMDNVRLSLDGPQEEEHSVANMCLYSFYHHMYFPRRARFLFERYALFQGVSSVEIERWKTIYQRVLKIATLKAGGKRLLIKNPSLTGRIRAVLELYPDAKFIYIYRNPYEVFLSTRHFYQKAYQNLGLQAISPEENEANILAFYPLLLHQYAADKALIPPGNLAEVRYETLIAQPLDTVQAVYRQLGLSGYAAAEPRFRTYIAAQKTYQKNRFVISPADIEKVQQHWGFALKEGDYSLPEGTR